MDNSAPENEGPIPIGQRLMDNIYLWIIIGISLPLVFYFAWGVFELLTLGEMPTYNFGGN